MNAEHLRFAWWLDEEGHPWVEHDCLGFVDVYRLPPPWQMVDDRLVASFACDKCGAHTILNHNDRCDTPEGFEYARCLAPDDPHRATAPSRAPSEEKP